MFDFFARKEVSLATPKCCFNREVCSQAACSFWPRQPMDAAKLNLLEMISASLAVRELSQRGKLTPEIARAPQALALRRLLGHGPPRESRYLLEHLPKDVCIALVQGVADDDYGGVDRFAKERRIGALANCARAIRHLKTDVAEAILMTLKQLDLPLYHLFERVAWWMFDDLQFVDAKDGKDLLAQFDLETLCLALKGADEMVAAYIWDSLSRSTVTKLQRAMTDTTAVLLSEVNAAQDAMLNSVIARFESGGVIVNLASHAEMLARQQQELTTN